MMCNHSHKKLRWKSSIGTSSFWTKIIDSAFPDNTYVIELPVLKDLYRLLVFLSSETQWTVQEEFCSHEYDLQMCHDCVNICKLSHILFKKLEESFEQCVSTIFVVSKNKDLGGRSFCIGLYDVMECLNLSLRCCMALLTLIIDKKDLVLEKGKVLLRILAKVSSVNLSDKTGKHALMSEKSRQGDNGFNTSVENFSDSLQFPESHSQLLHVKSAILEVLIDELLVHEHLRGHLEKIDLAASISDDQYYPQFMNGGIGSVIGAICHHFILTFSDKQAFGDFFLRLFCVSAIESIDRLRAPGLRMTAAVSLLSSPVMISAPKFMQAHVVSLVTRTMYSLVNIEGAKSDHKLINCFLSTLEKSVIMYMAHMSGCQKDGYSTCASGSVTSKISHKIAYPLFESYMSADMKNQVHNLINELDHFPNLNLHDSLTRTKSDLVSSSISFVKEHQSIYDFSCQDEIMSVLICLIHKASGSLDNTAPDPIEGTALQNIFLLASLLKLMSTSLLQAIRCLRHSDDPCDLKVLKDLSSCKEYDFILLSIKYFGVLQFSLPLEENLSNIMSCHSTRHMDSRFMFLHFSGLMSQSFASGRDCLVKGCLLMIMAVLNLFVFEEGNLDVLFSMIESSSESLSARSPHVIKFQETLAGEKSAFVVASKFQKLRRLRVSKLGNNSMETEASPSLSHRAGNGEIFFECLWNMGQERSDIGDLVDFVACEEPDEYTAWFKNRQIYHKRKGERNVLRWKRKKKSWRKTRGK